VEQDKLRGIAGGKSRLPARAISLDPEAGEGHRSAGEFMVPAADSQGHSARIFCRVPPSIKHQITRLVGSQQNPWETESDVVRWCVYVGLERLRDMTDDPEYRSAQSLLNAFVEAARIQMEHLYFARTLDEIGRQVNQLVQAGATAAARKVIEAVAERVAAFEEPYWRRRYEAELVERFDYLKGKGKGRGGGGGGGGGKPKKPAAHAGEE
jgi:hypothetical protein